MSTDVHAEIDRQCSEKGISHEDAQTIHDFASFLEDPASRCPVCLQPFEGGHRPSNHREVMQDGRRLLGQVLTETELAHRVDNAYRRSIDATVRRHAERSKR